MTETDWVGRKATIGTVVSEHETADNYGNKGVQVLATPVLVALFERASMEAIRDLLAPGEISVGAEVDIRHRAPTPLGGRVNVTAVVRESDGQSVWFDVSATDDVEAIGSGRHRRFIVDEASFQRRVAAKQPT